MLTLGHYWLTFYDQPEALQPPSDAAGQAAYFGAWMAYIGAMRQAGVMLNGHGLMPPYTATTVRMRENKRVVQDGPYADTKEMLGGYAVIEVASLDDALLWASRCPAALTGTVEVRPTIAPVPQAAAR